MAAFKNKDNGTWYVQFRYTDWKGERQQKLKRGFATKREALEWEREFLMEKQADVNMTLLHRTLLGMTRSECLRYPEFPGLKSSVRALKLKHVKQSDSM